MGPPGANPALPMRAEPLRILRWVFNALGGFFALVGGGLLAGGLYVANQKHQELTTWPTVAAEVVESHVARQESTDSEGRASTMFRAEIEFRYEFDGEEYITPATASYWTSSYSSMQAKVDRFAPETRHPILLNPANPREIYFDAGYDAGFFLVPLILGGIGAVFFLIGGGMLVAARVLRPALCLSCGNSVERKAHVCPHCGAAVPVH